MKDDNLPEILLGSGQTLVTFSSPALQLQAFGPQTANVDEQLTYNATLANPGDRDAENVKLTMLIPSGMQFVSAVPEPRQYQDQLLWDQGGPGRATTTRRSRRAARPNKLETTKFLSLAVANPI